jgi:hydrogenase-4 component B
MSFIKNPGAQSVYETWGCGQPTSTARNEYTACAFSKPVQMWFKNIFRPVRELRASYTVSPLIKESFKFEVHIEQIFERYIYSPVSDAILGRSRNIKRIQTGSIHAYLSYIFGTMVILMLYIILGGS